MRNLLRLAGRTAALLYPKIPEYGSSLRSERSKRRGIRGSGFIKYLGSLVKEVISS